MCCFYITVGDIGNNYLLVSVHSSDSICHICDNTIAASGRKQGDRQMIFTHFAKLDAHHVGFDIDHCEECGTACQVNPVVIRSPKSKILKTGAEFIGHIPDELVIDDRDQAVCWDCAVMEE